MDGILTLVAVLVVIILQFITIFIVLSNRKPGGRPGGAPRQGVEGRPERKDGVDPRRAQGGSGSGRKPVENRDRGGRPPQQGGRRPQQQQQQSQPAAIDPMEKSLRDINLRLKNAEREQENARRKIQDGDSRDGRPQQQRGERNDRGDRNDRGGNRGGNGGDRGAPQQGGRRDFNREPRRDGGRPDRPERQGRGEVDGQEQSGPQFQERPPRQFQQPEQNMTGGPQAPEIVPNDLGVSEDQLQHGRKFTAKRRPLPENVGGGDAAHETDAPDVSMPTPPPVIESAQLEQSQDDGAIQFGRR